MKKKLISSILLLVAIALVISNAIGIFVFREREIDTTRSNLEDILELIDEQIVYSDYNALARQYGDALTDKRITFIAGNGAVIVDSIAESETMGNHSDRPEFIEALEDGWGEDIRTSATTGVSMLYVAKLLQNGTVARISVPISSINTLVLGAIDGFIIAALIALVLSFLLASRLARHQVGQTTRIYDALEGILDGKAAPLPEEYSKYDELRPIIRSMNRLIEKINTYISSLKAESEKVSLILDCMEEGLILIDEKIKILAVNRAARAFLGISSEQVGHSLLYVSHNTKLRNAVRLAVEEKKADIVDYHDPIITGRFLRFFINPVSETRFEQSGIGASILIFDVTELKKAERIRSDFTANVSHELKTPLTSIKGFTDMLSGGIVNDPETTRRFITMISVEVDRLISLINDILKLSELEAVSIEQPGERSEVLSVARDVVGMLSPMASSADVSLTVNGVEEAEIAISPGRLRELYINLIENAIKYNVPGGSVSVSIKCERDKVSISVSDTGIGIPEEHQGRVFERFYRVDKGRSKEAGGTGLGLAIVKHITALYGGTLNLESKPDSGTTITAVFPRA